MALNKAVELPSGVIVNYHRVTSLNIITNVQNMIEISGYTSEAKRQEEQTALENGKTADIFIHTTILSAPYEQTATIEQVYEYLKTLPEYAGAENV